MLSGCFDLGGIDVVVNFFLCLIVKFVLLVGWEDLWVVDGVVNVVVVVV